MREKGDERYTEAKAEESEEREMHKISKWMFEKEKEEKRGRHKDMEKGE